MTAPRYTNEAVAPPGILDAMLRTHLNRVAADAARTDDTRRSEIDAIDEVKLQVRHEDIFGSRDIPNIAHWDIYFVDSSRGNILLNLPIVDENAGKFVHFKKTVAANTVTVRSPDSTIDGAATLAISTLNASLGLYCTGVVWFILFQ